MTATAVLLGVGVVAFAGIAMTAAPAVSRPTVTFGVRVPPERTQVPSVVAARRAYTVRSGAVAASCTTAAFLLPASAPWWALRLILLLELAASVGCQPTLLPFAAGLTTVALVLTRTGQSGFRLAPATAPPGAPRTVDRDDDRQWKAGLLYINRGDPALLVAARFGAGWTVNLANPAA